MGDITKTTEWRRLESLRGRPDRARIASLFADDADRARLYSVEAAGIFLDFSKNRIDRLAMDALFDLAEAAGLEAARARLFAGEIVNVTEGRPALHMAVRDRSGRDWRAGGESVAAMIAAERARCAAFVKGVHDGAFNGFTGARLDTVVNIGIGGSDLGPQMAVEALRPYHIAGRRTFFVSNVDGAALDDALSQCDPARTLFLIASKTFTTDETMTNARSARAWFLEQGGREADIARHFAALSTNETLTGAFGIDRVQTFPFWDWVGGRYSLWSSIGLSIALAIGFDRFEEMLDGAAAMDRHFETAPTARNLPALMALVGLWNRNFEGAGAHAILPYHQHLHRLPAYLQQADMESNGKSRRADGAPVALATGPVIFGEPGTNGQHAFYQLLHQGTDLISADFIAVARPHQERGDHHRKLLANLLAQSEALMIGRGEDEARAAMRAGGLSEAEAMRLAPHRAFTGDRPSNVLLIEQLTPFSLGALIAAYEHKIFCQSVLWGVNAFDQWGVELGKTLAARILPEIASPGAPATGHDGSTNALIDRLNAMRAPAASS
jgi:glucose-6-phosphate isomerase